jgi:hypothetical protein
MDAQLKLTPRRREGQTCANGTYKSARHFLDFVVNEQSLWEALGKMHDMVSVLCAEFSVQATAKAADRLLLADAADLPNGRRSLFICSECGDLGCGAITVEVNKENGQIIWKHFGYENTWENRVELGVYAEIGPFTFDAGKYERTLTQAKANFR